MSEYEVWIPELQAFQTPLQIASQVQRCGGRAHERAARGSDAITSDRSLQDECRHLTAKLAVLQETFDHTSPLLEADDDRRALHEEIDLVVQEFGALGSRVAMSGISDWTTPAPVHSSPAAALDAPLAPNDLPGRDSSVSLYQAVPDLKQDLHSASWHAREDVVWQAVEYLRVRLRDNSAALQHSCELLSEVFAVAKHVLHDSHAQVFVAACSLLHEALRLGSAPLQRDSNSIATAKPSLVNVLDVLLERLDDHQGVVRTNAAFSILKVAEQTRNGGTFVMHYVLAKTERKQLHVTDHALHALLKLFAALLLSFHCCASMDIAPRRVLRFLRRTDVAMHASPHIRDAAKHLTLVLYDEVGPEVLQSYVQQLSAEVQTMYETLFALRDAKEKKRVVTTSDSDR